MNPKQCHDKEVTRIVTCNNKNFKEAFTTISSKQLKWKHISLIMYFANLGLHINIECDIESSVIRDFITVK